VLVGILVALAAVTPVHAQEQRGVASEWPSPLADPAVLLPRLWSPLQAAMIGDRPAQGGDSVGHHDIDLRAEAFDIYVPPHHPEGGFGVLVFLPPSPSWPVPADWREALDRAGLIYVAPRAAGNNQSVVGRRIPLMLHALTLVETRYPVNPQQRFVSGFSGGGRVAMRVAVAFPDLFSGALLFAGSDEIGTHGVVLPERQLVDRLVEQSRFVFVTGAKDVPNRRHDARSLRSLEAICATNLTRISVPGLEHALPPGATLQAGLAALMRAPTPPHTACLRQRDAAITAELDAIEEQLDAGQTIAAAERLRSLDARAGGLAAPRSVELARGQTERFPDMNADGGRP
jgi:hypothetical protein